MKIIAPIVPHLAEEVYEATGSPGRKPSVFLEHWKENVRRSRTSVILIPLQDAWIDRAAADEMSVLLEIRNVVLGMLEGARQDK